LDNPLRNGIFEITTSLHKTECFKLRESDYFDSPRRIPQIRDFNHYVHGAANLSLSKRGRPQFHLKSFARDLALKFGRADPGDVNSRTREMANVICQLLSELPSKEIEVSTIVSLKIESKSPKFWLKFSI
jgi:hypothetical protein